MFHEQEHPDDESYEKLANGVIENAREKIAEGKGGVGSTNKPFCVGIQSSAHGRLALKIATLLNQELPDFNVNIFQSDVDDKQQQLPGAKKVGLVCILPPVGVTDSNVPISSSSFKAPKGARPLPGYMDIVVARHCFYDRQV